MLVQLALCAGLLLGTQGPWEEPIPASGRADPRLTSFDVLMREFMREHEVPGAALAVSRGGRLVYARGFGYANLEAREEVAPEAVFRIASISKPITSAVVLLLAQRGELELDDPVLLHLDPALMRGRLPRDARWADVTIRQLLQHRAGFDRGLSGDPMFNPTKVDPRAKGRTSVGVEQIIHYMFQRRIDRDPGTHYAYSNFGYCLLGRVIEHETGEDYEAAVRRLVLEPLGATSMRIGGNFERDRGAGEVTYHTGNEPGVRGEERSGSHTAGAYGMWNQRALDSVGGWVASAPDLLRVMRLFDGPEGTRLLEPSTLELMLARPPVGQAEEEKPRRWYGMGWSVLQLESGTPNIWHNGSLPGTQTLLVRRGDGLAWAVLFNARFNPQGEELADLIDSQVHKAAREVRVWPEFDLFELGSVGQPAGR